MNAAFIRELALRASEIWQDGGWGMIALTINALVMYGLAMSIFLSLWMKGVYSSADREWKRWKRKRHRARGKLAAIVKRAMHSRNTEELIHYFEGVQNDEVLPFERDLGVMKVSVAAAPLLGLLGTVSGMLTTFDALAVGGGGDKTMGMIAKGISQALITTETGLVMALTGLFLQFILTRQHEKYERLLSHLENLCADYLKQNVPAAGGVA